MHWDSRPASVQAQTLSVGADRAQSALLPALTSAQSLEQVVGALQGDDASVYGCRGSKAAQLAEQAVLSLCLAAHESQQGPGWRDPPHQQVGQD